MVNASKNHKSALEYYQSLGKEQQSRMSGSNSMKRNSGGLRDTDFSAESQKSVHNK